MSIEPALSPQTAPRSLQQLLTETPFKLRMLARSLGGLETDEQRMAWHNMGEDTRADFVLSLLQGWDKANPGQAPPPAPEPSNQPPPALQVAPPPQQPPPSYQPPQPPPQMAPPQYQPPQAPQQQYQPPQPQGYQPPAGPPQYQPPPAQQYAPPPQYQPPQEPQRTPVNGHAGPAAYQPPQPPPGIPMQQLQPQAPPQAQEPPPAAEAPTKGKRTPRTTAAAAPVGDAESSQLVALLHGLLKNNQANQEANEAIWKETLEAARAGAVQTHSDAFSGRILQTMHNIQNNQAVMLSMLLAFVSNASGTPPANMLTMALDDSATLPGLFAQAEVALGRTPGKA